MFRVGGISVFKALFWEINFHVSRGYVLGDDVMHNKERRVGVSVMLIWGKSTARTKRMLVKWRVIPVRNSKNFRECCKEDSSPVLSFSLIYLLLQLCSRVAFCTKVNAIGIYILWSFYFSIDSHTTDVIRSLFQIICTEHRFPICLHWCKWALANPSWEPGRHMLCNRISSPDKLPQFPPYYNRYTGFSYQLALLSLF